MTHCKWLSGPVEYLPVWQAMREFTEARTDGTPDEIWLAEHQPVYTLGQAGKPEHVLNSGSVPVVHCDRGGQVTYHGPGQVMAYCLVDLRRMNLFVKEYVALLEDVIIQVLGELGLAGACRKAGAPGVYVPVSHLLPEFRLAPGPGDDGLAKIAALGIKIRKGCAYHGLALNVDMNLDPFLGINPCGYEGLQTVDLRSCGVQATVAEVGDLLARRLMQAFNQGEPA
ncbi:lipoyl(octanoyl) transferase LipB [Pollutimonas harenae]|uniref:Octanoyltransferase n=1 Tax=Pollutimonas harenae TaxID=657015 RepID=A0A853GY41_9BURK|nr:lipoyl(octanoyl) transferase LipB [Pollutimonas harenae]NYT84289.1 lipoyl(octanoyl) transferase LipB [Pollutimonas harenae]TEA73305.1 lipoyl(octanoyl) transferase LipB [Pollutimonas harenae]